MIHGSIRRRRVLRHDDRQNDREGTAAKGKMSSEPPFAMNDNEIVVKRGGVPLQSSILPFPLPVPRSRRFFKSDKLIPRARA